MFQTEKVFQAIVDAVPAMIAIYDVHTGEYFFVSQTCRKLLGYDPDVFKAKGREFAISLVHPDDIARILKEGSKALKMANAKKSIPDNDEIASFEFRMKHKNGEYIWLSTDARIFSRDKSGKVEKMMNVSVNITARKLIELKSVSHRSELEERIKSSTYDLQQSEERLRIATEAGKIGIWDWDIITNKIVWSDQVYKIHRISKKEFDGSFEEYIKKIHPDDFKKRERALKLALSNKKNYNIEFRLLMKDKSIVWIQTSARVIFDKAGKPVRMLGATRDITARKELEERKDDFVALASHELKTPITSLKITAQLLQKKFESINDPRVTQQLTTMNNQIDKLTQLINGMLDISKSREGKYRYKMTSFSMDELAKEVVKNIQSITKTHLIKLKSLPHARVVGDQQRIGQVLINLINNAIKYSPKSKKVVVTIQQTQNHLKVSVKDYGIGIPTHLQEHVFDKFFQAKHHLKQTFPGLGLGLYIVKEIIDNHHGELSMTSSIDKGSTFFFTLPLPKVRK